MRQLSGLDASFLYLETAEMPMHVGALSVYELPREHRGDFAKARSEAAQQSLYLPPEVRP